MAQKKSPQDDRLIQDLYEKLNWFTFHAAQEEFDPEQVKTIVKLLDALDPMGEKAPGKERFGKEQSGKKQSEKEQPEKEQLSCGHEADGTPAGGKAALDSRAAYADAAPDPDAAFARFKQKYNLSDADLQKKDHTASKGKVVSFQKNSAETSEFSEELSILADDKIQNEPLPGHAASASNRKKKPANRRFLSSTFGKTAAVLLVAGIAFAGLNIGTAAVGQKSFIELVKQGINSLDITVTGNEMESESGGWVSSEGEPVYYKSWDELEEALGADILRPGYLPEDMELEEMYCKNVGHRKICLVHYRGEENLYIGLDIYEKDYAVGSIESLEEWTELEKEKIGEKEISYFSCAGNFRAFFANKRVIYRIEYQDLNELKKIVASMK